MTTPDTLQFTYDPGQGKIADPKFGGGPRLPGGFHADTAIIEVGTSKNNEKFGGVSLSVNFQNGKGESSLLFLDIPGTGGKRDKAAGEKINRLLAAAGLHAMIASPGKNFALLKGRPCPVWVEEKDEDDDSRARILPLLPQEAQGAAAGAWRPESGNAGNAPGAGSAIPGAGIPQGQPQGQPQGFPQQMGNQPVNGGFQPQGQPQGFPQQGQGGFPQGQPQGFPQGFPQGGGFPQGQGGGFPQGFPQQGQGFPGA